MLYILFLIINLSFAFFIFFLCIAFAYGAPFVPSSTKASHTIIKLAHIKPGDHIYDLGSGDGKLLFLAAKQGATATGYEINPYLVLYTKLRALFSPLRSQIHVYWKNFWHADVGDADAVFVYLIPWKMDKLEAMLQKKCKKSVRIVSNSFIFPHLKQIGADPAAHIYVFTV